MRGGGKRGEGRRGKDILVLRVCEYAADVHVLGIKQGPSTQ